ncbi:MAG: hypothetical protein EOO61_17675 [Hymenobacter sp.]|nr:MAG: hypothetical protein EOO61_17675 [Hymenobacter sp.]
MQVFELNEVKDGKAYNKQHKCCIEQFCDMGFDKKHHCKGFCWFITKANFSALIPLSFLSS